METIKTEDSRRILIIDDNPSIHADFKKILGAKEMDAEFAKAEAALFGDVGSVPVDEAGFDLTFANQGHLGLEAVRESLRIDRPFAMAFVDVRMPPGWDGIETIERIWREYPDLQVVICTAYSDYSLDEILQKLGRSDRLVVLKKPFDNIEVLQLGHALTEKWRLLRESQARTDDLERRVRERTRELELANEKLQAEMAERQRTEEALRHSQKMEVVGQLAGGIAHDFNNILSVIQGHAQYLLAEPNLDITVRDSLEHISYASERAASLTRQLLAFSRKQPMRRELLDVKEMLSCLEKMLHRVLRKDITMQMQLSDGLPAVHADRAMVEQVLLNLVINARDAMPEGGRLFIRAEAVEFGMIPLHRTVHARAGNFVCITVTDTGCGIPAEVMPRLFEPFFTTKEVGKGTGLGLATAHTIVRQHEGWINVESFPNRGATFRIFLPTKAESQTIQLSAQTTEPTGAEVILLVEDDPNILLLAQKMLQRHGYRVLGAASGVEALTLWERHAGEIALLLTDMIMPEGISGGDLARKLRSDKPDLKVICCSGYSPELVTPNGDFGFEFLAKPYSPEQLTSLIRKTLNSRLEATLCA